MSLSSILAAACVLMASACLGLSADEEGLVSVQFIRVPGTADHRSALLQLADGSTVEIELPTEVLSEAYQVQKPEAWVLGKTVQDDEGNPSFKPVGRAPTTSGKRQVVVVIDKGQANDGKLELIAIDLDATADSFLFVNASKFDISGELGIERFGIAPGEYAQQKAEATESDQHGRRFCTAAFSFLKDKKDEQYVKFFHANWLLEDGVFGLIIFHHEAMADKLKINVIRDFVE